MTLCDPLECSSLSKQPGSSVHGISQARIREWVATSSSRELAHPGIHTPVSPAFQADFFYQLKPATEPLTCKYRISSITGLQRVDKTATKQQQIQKDKTTFSWVEEEQFSILILNVIQEVTVLKIEQVTVKGYILKS